jgi:dTDP-4-dehydrorhamnose 3,5-epimerase
LKVVRTEIPEVLLLEPQVFEDERGAVFESYNRRAFAQATGVDPQFVQDNHSRSNLNVLRGLHYQIKQPQGKLVRVTLGEVWDIAVDIRRRSPTFGRWTAFTLSAQSKRMAWIPEGFAHGFLVTSEVAEVQYKVTDYYAPEHQRTILWSDPELAISWPLAGRAPHIAEKDRLAEPLSKAQVYE